MNAAECEELLAQEGPAFRQADVPAVFGATEDDTASLRIVSLQEVRLLMRQFCQASVPQRLTTLGAQVDFDSLEAQFRNQ